MLSNVNVSEELIVNLQDWGEETGCYPEIVQQLWEGEGVLQDRSWSLSPILFSWFIWVVKASETEDTSAMGEPNRVALEGQLS